LKPSREFHPTLNGKNLIFIVLAHINVFQGRPCDENGDYLPPNTPPPPPTNPSTTDWAPYNDRLEFETADFLFRRNQMSGGDINILMDLWAASLLKHGDPPPFADHDDMYATIDSTPLGDIPWQSFTATFSGTKPQNSVPSWMDGTYDVWFRDPRTVVQNIIGNQDFDGEFDFAPHQDFDAGGERQYQDFMSGDWAWDQAVCLLFIYHVPISLVTSF
jgi:hypothetical protein